MFTTNKKMKFGFKIVSLLTCLMFISSNLSAAGMPLPAPKAFADSQFFEPVTGKEIAQWGRIKTQFKGAGPQKVIYIQDAHINEDAQKNIAALIKHLAETRGLKLVNVEGAAEELIHRPLSLYPDARAREFVAEYFLKQGFLAGPEYAAITSNPELRLFGIEDKHLYESNRAVYLDALKFKHKDEQLLARLRGRIEQMGRYIFPQDFRQLLKYRGLFEEGGHKLVDYVVFLKKTAAETGMLWDYPRLDAVLETAELEKQEKSEQTRKQLREAYAKLGIRIFDEMNSLEKILRVKLLKTAEQKDLGRLFDFVEVSEKMLDFSLTREDAEFYYKNRGEFESPEFQSVLNRLLVKYGFAQESFSLKELGRNLAKIAEFYTLALKRDRVLASRTAENMDKTGEHVSVVVAGGFHTPGIEKIFREKNISYFVLTPNLKKIDARQEKELYARAMGGQEIWFQKVLPALQSQTVNDTAFQLQPPKMLPAFGSLGSEVGSPAPSFFRHAMIAMNIEGLRVRNGKLAPPSINQVFSRLLPEEKLLAAEVYPLINHRSALIKSDSSGAGTFLSPLPSNNDAAAIGAQWRPATAPQSWQEWKFKSGNEMVLPGDDVTVRIRAINRQDYPFVRASFEHAQNTTTASRSEVREVESGNMRFTLRKFWNNEEIPGDQERVEKILKNTDIVARIKKSLTEAGVEVSEAVRFIVGVRMHSALSDGRKVARPGAEDKPVERVYKIMVATPKGLLTFIYKVTPEGQWSFRAYSQNLNRLANLMQKSVKKDGSPAGLKTVFEAAGVEVKPYSTVYVETLAPDTYAMRLEKQEKAPVKIKVEKQAEAEKIEKDEDRPMEVLTSQFQGEVFLISVFLSPFKALELLKQLYKKVAAGFFKAGSKGVESLARRLHRQAKEKVPAGRSELRCGNASISGHVENSKGLDTYLSRLSQSIMITEIRGKISMGFYMIMEDRNGNRAILHEKYMITKRKQAKDALSVFAGLVRGAARSMKGPYNLVIGVHLRWPTGGALEKDMYMEEIEQGAHPHSWLGVNAITHNGDFDYLMHKTKKYTNEAVGWMLRRVHKKRNDTTGDSPKGAGMMDLVLVQGDWEKTARFAHFEAVTDGLEDYFGGTLPSNAEAEKTAPDTSLSVAEEKSLAEFMNAVFERHGGRDILNGLNGKDLSVVDPKVLSELKNKMIGELQKDLGNTPAAQLFRKWGTAKSKAFINTAVEAFFKNSSYQTWKIIMPRFLGSAGINAYSPSSVNKLTAVSLISPISIAYGFKDGIIQFGSFSERKAANGEGYQYIFDLDPMGEIAEISHNGEEVSLRVYSIPQGRELTQKEIQARVRPTKPFSPLSRKALADPLEDEARKTPSNLNAVRKEWKGIPTAEVPQPHNLGVAAEFATALFRNPIGKRIVSGVRQNIEDGHLDSLMMQWASESAQKFMQMHDGFTWGAPPREVLQRFIAEILHREILAILTEDVFTRAVLDASLPIASGLVRGNFKPQELQKKIDDAVFQLLSKSFTEGEENLFQQAQARALEKFEMLDRQSGPGLAADIQRVVEAPKPLQKQTEYRVRHNYLKEIPRYETNGPDIVLYGKEKNEEHFLEWIDFFKKLLPNLKVIFLEPNHILEEAERFTRDENDADKRLENMDVEGLRQRLGLTNPYLVALGAGESGQTFPAAVSTTLLVRLIPEVFLMTADIDSPMARDVGPGRTFLFRSGWSPAEVHVAATSSARLTLLELGLYLTRLAIDKFPDEKLFGRRYEASDLNEIEGLRDNFLTSSVPKITGYTTEGKLEAEDAPDHNKLAEEGKALGRRINESVDVWVLSAIYIFATVALPQLGVAIPPLFLGLNMLISPFFSFAGPVALFTGIVMVIYSMALMFYLAGLTSAWLSGQPMPKRFTAKIFARSTTFAAVVLGLVFWPGLLDTLFYIHMAGPIFPVILRFFVKQFVDHNSRSIQDRMGFKKIIIISKNRGIANLLAIALRKMFNQAYGINGITIHSTDSYRALDEHSGDRSTWIILLNRDGRIPDQQNAESAISMIGRQIKTILSLFFPFSHLFGLPLAGAYILDISSNPGTSPKASHKRIAVDTETHSPDKMSKRRIVQEIFGDSIDSFKQLLEGYVLLVNMARQAAKPVWYRPWSYWVAWAWHRTHGGTGVHTTAQPYGADAILPYLQKMPKVLRVIHEEETPQQAEENLPLEYEPVDELPAIDEDPSANYVLVDDTSDENGTQHKVEAGSSVPGNDDDLESLDPGDDEEADSILNKLIRGLHDDEPNNRNETRAEVRFNGLEKKAGVYTEDLGKALDESTSLKRAMRLAEELNFAELDKSASGFGFNLIAALKSFGTVLRDKLNISMPQTGETGGDLILNYKSSIHSDDFIRELYRKISSQPDGLHLYIFRDNSTPQQEWMRLKSLQSAWFQGAADRIQFVDRRQFRNLEELLAARLRARRLPKNSALQVLWPVLTGVKAQELKYIQAALLGAVSLAQSTVVIIGSETPISRVRSLSGPDIFKAIFANRKAFEVSA